MSETNKLVLVTGGARSGKSEFAEQLAERLAGENAAEGSLAYIATAQIFDAEMQQRVKLHQARRSKLWQTAEAPFDPHLTLLQVAQQCDVILFDCLTLYVSNLLLSPAAPENEEQHLALVLERIDQLIQACRSCSKTVILVTNEVGMGIVPENALARKYRDWAGWVNQKVAQAADQVYLVVSGLPVDIKKLATKLN